MALLERSAIHPALGKVCVTQPIICREGAWAHRGADRTALAGDDAIGLRESMERKRPSEPISGGLLDQKVHSSRSVGSRKDRNSPSDGVISRLVRAYLTAHDEAFANA